MNPSFALAISLTLPGWLAAQSRSSASTRPSARSDPKRAPTFLVSAWNVKALRSKVDFVFRHGFRNFHDLLFDVADPSAHHGSYGWRGLLRLLRARRARGCGSLYALSQGSDGGDKPCQ